MDVDVQKSLVEYIQQITDNPDNVLAFRPNDLAEYTAEWVVFNQLKWLCPRAKIQVKPNIFLYKKFVELQETDFE